MDLVPERVLLKRRAGTTLVPVRALAGRTPAKIVPAPEPVQDIVQGPPRCHCGAHLPGDPRAGVVICPRCGKVWQVV